ncbi:MAG: ABC transporter substrate-binding protein [Chloroflexota bacterium]
MRLTLILLFIIMVNITSLSAQDEVVCDDGLRLVTHELLDEAICVPENPERIAVLGTLHPIELMLLLDIEPVVRPSDRTLEALYGGSPAVYNRISEMVADIPINDVAGFDLDTLIEAEPDLIILRGSGYLVEQLEEIAYVFRSPSERDGFGASELDSLYAEVMDVSEDYEQLRANYEERVQVLLDNLEADVLGASMVYMQDANDDYYITLPGFAGWDIFSDVGFVPVDTLPTTADDAFETYGYHTFQVTQETLAALNVVDIIFMNSNIRPSGESEMSRAVIEKYETDSLLMSLEAVQNENLYPVSLYWQLSGLISAHLILDDMFMFFTDLNPQVVAPNPFLIDDTSSENTSD